MDHYYQPTMFIPAGCFPFHHKPSPLTLLDSEGQCWLDGVLNSTPHTQKHPPL